MVASFAPHTDSDDDGVVGWLAGWLARDAPDDITAERLNVSGGLDQD